MKQYILFINPEALYREEKFGGIFGIDSRTFLLGKREYSFIKKITSYCYYDDLNCQERKIADVLLDKQILLKLDSKKAEKIIHKQKLNK